jgi:hypothetical protein
LERLQNLWHLRQFDKQVDLLRRPEYLWPDPLDPLAPEGQ